MLIAIGLAVWEPLFASEAAPPPAHRYDTRIARDRWGVPHVFGTTDADVAYGIGYAHCRGRFRHHRRSAGDDARAAGRDEGVGRGEDRFRRPPARRARDGRPRLRQAARRRSRAARRLCQRREPATPAAIRRKCRSGNCSRSTARTWRPGSCCARRSSSGSTTCSARWRATSRCRSTARIPEANAPAITPVGPEGRENGSNAFLVAPKRSADGATRMVSNSHQPWRGGVAWYELVVHSKAGWNFAGATFPGAPYPLLGHNRTLGWTNTVNRPDLIDVYKLTHRRRSLPVSTGCGGRWSSGASGCRSSCSGRSSCRCPRRCGARCRGR